MRHVHANQRTLVDCMAEVTHKEVAPGTVVVTLSGKLMIGTASGEVVSLVESLLRSGARKIVLDLSGVPNIDSTWIGQIIAVYGKIAEADAEMRIAGAAGHVLHTFHISQLDSIFQFCPTVEEAMRD